MIERHRFGRTGRSSPRILFGAAALGAMRQERADAVLETLLEFGIDHLDTAASYGDAELRMAPWLRTERARFFVASKTAERRAGPARESIHRSLERLGIDRLDLIQLHNLTDEAGWQTAMGPGGALEAALDARSEGLVDWIGVTGHGTQAPAMHLRSLARFDFDSVLVPYSFPLMQAAEYASDFDRLIDTCRERSVAVQTIKSIARRRWRPDSAARRFAWYEPLADPEAIRRAVHFVLALPGVFLNSSSDATLLRIVLEAARDFDARRDADPDTDLLRADIVTHGMEPIFVKGVSDQI
jgi:aryl-alcohol dehydrogenase-like predicted oxidoreductase